MIIKDHYFGELHQDSASGEISVSLRALIEKGRLSGKSHFTEQLRRVLGQQGSVTAPDGSSAPPFPELMDCLDASKIGLVRFVRRTDVNQNTSTLECVLVFVEGTFSVTAHWCAWKELRAYELVDTLLVPIIRHGLIGRTLIPSEGGERSIPLGPVGMVRALFELADEPFSHITHGDIEGYSERVRAASEEVDAGR